MEPFLIINETPLAGASAQAGDLIDALAKAQGEFPAIPKSKVGKVSGQTQEGKRYEYEYHYADLSDIHSACRPVLSKHGVAVLQRLSIVGSALTVETIVAKGEQWISSKLTQSFNPGRNPAQAVGGLATYLKRYAYCAIIGVQAEEDTDEQRPEPEDHGPRRVEAKEVEGSITAAQQKKLREGLALTGLSLNKLIDAVVDEGEERPRLLKDIPADRFPRAEAAIERALRASEGGE